VEGKDEAIAEQERSGCCDYANLRELSTPEAVWRFYPGAFALLYVSHVGAA